jgi:ABC-2 type transport system ATP-binding protein
MATPFKKQICIKINDINKYFGEKQVLKNVSFEVPYAAVYGLLGPSGCGKTTTVKIISGILESTSGEAFVLGEKMPSLPLMSRIGYMAQSDALYPDLTAKENMEFFGALYGITGKIFERRFNEVMALVNLSEDKHKLVGAYSGGMKRRLSLAMAILHEPPVLILDEPTVGIDPLLRKNIWDELYRMTKDGVTILVTTHVMDEAEKCTHLSMMRAGALIVSGSPAKIQAKSGGHTLEEAFLFYAREGGGDEG